ncbi:MAG TPA: hypothetical protein VLE02_01255 [Nitrosarchaeum sp.]|nr:hypothetical protein [Nitrosarchaeum sp.]
MTDRPRERMCHYPYDEKHGKCLITVEYAKFIANYGIRDFVYNDTDLCMEPRDLCEFSCTNPSKLIFRITQYALKYPDVSITMG